MRRVGITGTFLLWSVLLNFAFTFGILARSAAAQGFGWMAYGLSAAFFLTGVALMFTSARVMQLLFRAGMRIVNRPLQCSM